MKYPFPSPKDFAVAEFGDVPIIGVEVGSINPNTGKEYTWSDSYRSCLEKVMGRMIVYNYDPTLLSNKQPLADIRKVDKSFAEGHHAYSSRSENYIYCKRCLNNSNKAEDFACCVIAIISPYKPDLDEKTTKGDNIKMKNAMVQVDAVIPHSSECHLPYLERRNCYMDKVHGGNGWIKFPFPTGHIIGDTYKKQMDKLQSIPENGEHFGMYI
jgi:hypothetical protein